MSLSLRWLKTKVLYWLARRRVSGVQQFIDTTGERYLDANLWAQMRGITHDQARAQLEAGVQMHLLEKCFLYEWPDAPVRFLVPTSELGHKIKLADIGYIGEDDDKEIVISPNRVRTVFVANENGTAVVGA